MSDTDLEGRFHEAMIGVYRQAKSEAREAVADHFDHGRCRRLGREWAGTPMRSPSTGVPPYTRSPGGQRVMTTSWYSTRGTRSPS